MTNHTTTNPVTVLVDRVPTEDVVTAADKNTRLWRMAVERAKAQHTPEVFDFMPRSVQRALIAEQILALLVAQDDDEVPDARVREAMVALQEILACW